MYCFRRRVLAQDGVEVLTFPISKKPIVFYMWSIGHTIRPNGEILEGNPAQVDEYIPLTRDNYLTYYSTLVSKALEYLDSSAQSK